MFLHSVGHFHPENVITNGFLQELGLETTDTWIRERVGVQTRHTVLPLDYIRETRNRDVREALKVAQYSNAETGRRASLMACERAGIKPSEIGMVIAGGCAPDECIPAESCRIAQALNLDVTAFDINAACSSFCAQLHVLDSMKPEKLPDYVLIVNPENSTRVVDYTDRASCVLWGDGTSAAVLSPRIPGRYRVAHTVLHGSPAGAGADRVRVPRAGHFIQDGAAVHQFAIKRATETFLELKRLYAAEAGDLAAAGLGLIGHQANLRMLEAVQRRTEVDSARHFFNVDRRGNCGASGAPTVLSEQWDLATLPRSLVLAVVGSGLTWAGALLERV